MSTKDYDQVILLLRKKVEKESQQAELGHYVLEAISDVRSINQLRGLIANRESFIRNFRKKEHLNDADMIADEVYNYLKKFLDEYFETVQLPNMAVSLSQESLGDYCRISGLDAFSLSSDMIEALKTTDASNTVDKALVLQNPICGFDKGISKLFENVTVLELKQLLIENDGDVAAVLAILGFKKGGSPNMKKTFATLLKSLSPAIIEYSSATLRNVLSSPDRLGENLYLLDFQTKANYVMQQLTYITAHLLADSHKEYVFGKIPPKTQKKTSYVGIDGNLQEQLTQYATPRFTLDEVKRGIHVPCVDLLGPVRVVGPAVARTRAPIERLFEVPKI